MKYRLFIVFSFTFLSTFVMAQNDNSSLPYYKIPEAPKKFTATNVAARMVDGLGFRYFWATEGLRKEDLEFKPSENGRTAEATIDHILGLSRVIVNAVQQKPNIRPAQQETLTFEEKRKQTLLNIKTASDILKSSKAKSFDNFDMVFKSDDRTSTYPFWNVINGPISDAIWHVGQIVSFRRSSGNPFNSKVSVLRGELRN